MLAASFTPLTLTVVKGTAVSFINDSGVGHNVAFDATRPPGVADIALHTSGTNARTFNDVGTFNFHCDQHAGMAAKVVVQ